MEKNKTGKYLKYAVGEIVLVVIGILIALGINNWNEENKKDIEANEYLTNLLSEFEANQEALKTDIEYHNFVKLKTKELSELMSPNPKEIKSNKLDTLMWAMMFYPQYKALDTQMNSDKLELVDDYNLKNNIAYWKLTYDSYRYRLGLTYDQFMNHIYPFMTENYQIKNIKSSMFESDRSLFPVFTKSILSNPIFENQVKLRSLNAENISKDATELYNLQKNLIQYIELKLENKK